MTDNEDESVIKKKYQDLSLDLNLDKATADEAWNNYETIKTSYSLEGDQLPWLACALYTACRKRSIPTVGGRPGNVIQGNCVSLTRMLQQCSLPLTDFIMKMKSWLAMSHCDEHFCRRIDLLERNFAVSSNIFKEYKPIFLDLFQDPNKDQPRPPRSRKQRRPPCNATELFNFCWALYIFIKGKYPSIPQDLVSCFSLLLACIDLMYTNVVVSNRKDLLNPSCKGLPEGLVEMDASEDLSSYPVSVMDYLCKKFEGVVVDTKIVRDYYCKINIQDLVDQGTLKGNRDGTSLLDQVNFAHNFKEIKNAYEEYLLNCGEFDERMFLNDPQMVKGCSRVSSPVLRTHDGSSLCNSTPIKSARYNLSQAFEGDKADHHLVPQTPITGRLYTHNRPVVGNTPITIVTTGLQKLYALIAGRKNSPGPKLLDIFSSLPTNPEETISSLITEMSDSFVKLYSQDTEDYTAPSIEFTKMRLQTGQILYYTFLEHILIDEEKRKVDLEAILREELFHRTLFTCCLEIVLKSYNDARRFPWSLQVGNVEPYYFMRIIEPVIRSEKQSENQLSRELVKHLKGIEEQILDSLSWQSKSPLWQIIKDTGDGVPSCQDVNFSHQLESSGIEWNLSHSLPSSSIMSPAVKVNKEVPQSPLSSIQDRMNSPNNSSARRMLFPTNASAGSTPFANQLKGLQPDSLFMGVKCSGPSAQQQQSVTNEAKEQVDGPIREPDIFYTGDPASALNSIRITKEEISFVIYKLRINKSPGPDRVYARQALIVDSILMSSAPTSDLPVNQDVKKDKPRRHGSLALFFRKFYTLANMRLRDLCDRLDILSNELRQMIWTCFEHSVIHYTDMMRDRHMDQMIMCAVYIVCKVTGADKIFQEIMKHYRRQPQAASHVFRSVLISRTSTGHVESMPAALKQEFGPPLTPSQLRGTSVSMPSGERGDLIKFYNMIYVINIKNFALKFRKAQGDVPRLSPLPVARTTPISPRRRVSHHHSVFINTLSSHSPLKGNSTLSPRPPLPYFFNRSPAKDLRVINNMVKIQGGCTKRLLDAGEAETKISRLESFGGVKKRMQCVLEQRNSTTPSQLITTEQIVQLPCDTQVTVVSSVGSLINNGKDDSSNS